MSGDDDVCYKVKLSQTIRMSNAYQSSLDDYANTESAAEIGVKYQYVW